MSVVVEMFPTSFEPSNPRDFSRGLLGEAPAAVRVGGFTGK